MWSAWSESAKSSITSALEKTGDAITKAATNARHRDHPFPATTLAATGGDDAALSAGGDVHSPSSSVVGRYARAEESEPAVVVEKQADALFKNLQVGWSSVVESTKSVVESTKAGIKVAQVKLEEEQHKLTERISKARSAYYKRDLELPLDVVALKDAEVVYLTDRLITLSHPAAASSSHPDIITPERKLAAVGHLLKKRHGGRYMVWNLSEVDYDIDILDDQVLTFSFPGSPSPPLGLLLKLLISMESWLKADERNVAVVHCLTGKGRTSTVMAAFLCWMGEAGFSDINEALAYIAACKHLAPEDLTIPSQRRYASYFKNMLDSVRPSQPPLMLKRVIMSEAPRFAMGPPIDSKDGSDSLPSSGKSTPTKSIGAVSDDLLRMGCAPYLQVFKGGKLLHTAPASLTSQPANAKELTFCQVADGSVSFHINQVVQGDILIRCRHLTAQRERISMFRAAFHTGYVPPKVMRLTKSQLDGACNDSRFSEDFFLDLIFEAVDAETASKILVEGTGDGGDNESPLSSPTTESRSPPLQGVGSEQARLLAGGSSAVVHASSYDTMLHRDSRFWEVIAARRELHSHAQGVAKDDPTWGPTVGRRRDFGSRKAGGRASKAEGSEGSGPTTEHLAALETFSIGGELDFLPETVEPEQDTPKAAALEPKPPKKDSLMEALMGALTDDDHKDVLDDSEEIVFDDETDDGAPKASATPEKVPPPIATAAPTIVQLPPLPSAPEKAQASRHTFFPSSGATLSQSVTGDAPPSGKQSAPPSGNDDGDAPSGVASATSQKQPRPQAPTQDGSAEEVKSVDAMTGSDDNTEDIDALLATAGVVTVDDLDLENLDVGDVDLLAVDDADLEDMESFLAGSASATK
jgi:tensin